MAEFNSERRQRVLELLEEGHALVANISGHMVEIEQLLRMDDDDSDNGEGGDG